MGLNEVGVRDRGPQLRQRKQARLHDPPDGRLAGFELRLELRVYGAGLAGLAGWPESSLCFSTSHAKKSG